MAYLDRTPFMHSITIPSNAAIPASIKEECVCYYVKLELHQTGLIEKMTTFGNSVKCYDAERTICDMIRSRNRLDEEMVISAMKNYSNYVDKDLNRLGIYAEQFKVSEELKHYLDVLL